MLTQVPLGENWKVSHSLGFCRCCCPAKAGPTCQVAPEAPLGCRLSVRMNLALKRPLPEAAPPSASFPFMRSACCSFTCMCMQPPKQLHLRRAWNQQVSEVYPTPPSWPFMSSASCTCTC